ncbi:hypothetical protein G7085_07590 [Tessaracoccus sp. HDW20]|uniref:hypothetical protein n=1 Tax=Tessaracoccus coleopterorum TaxID=2714950 RepID=UPI0018D38F8A|nr:hypothetical protein [Tessaracoccus coleopterorum]NHB84512.1 hypothetical protein [Tessaracoccus coleopterorum]
MGRRFRRPLGNRPGQGVAARTGDRAKDVTATAKDEAKEVADTAKDAGGHVVETAKQEAATVVDEAKVQGKRLLDESMCELRAQAGTGQQMVAELARSLSGELRSMSEADQDGMLGRYMDKAQRFSDEAAAWLESRRPDEVLESVRRYAARNPWQFLAISAGVGFIGARIVRGLQGAKADEERLAQPAAGYRPVAGMPVTPPASQFADPYVASTQGAAPRRESRMSNRTFAEPEPRYEDLPVEGGDPWREGLR